MGGAARVERGATTWTLGGPARERFVVKRFVVCGVVGSLFDIHIYTACIGFWLERVKHGTRRFGEGASIASAFGRSRVAL